MDASPARDGARTVTRAILSPFPTIERSTLPTKAAARCRAAAPAITAAAIALALSLAALAAAPQAAVAKPAYPNLITASQPDGSQASFYLHGDEYFSYKTSPDGTLLQTDPETGALCIVMQSADGSLSLGPQASDATSADGGMARAANAQSAATADALSDEQARIAYRALAGRSASTFEAADFPLMSLSAGISTFSTADAGGNPIADALGGAQALPSSIPLITIVVGFSDMPSRDDYDWSVPLFESEYSTKAFWSDASNGRFTFGPAAETSAFGANGNANAADEENDGVVHVTLDRPHGNWGVPGDSEEETADWVSTLQQAYDAADDMVDFASFDTNGDGTISTDELAISFVIAGYESSANGSSEKSIWAHAWKADLSADGVAIPQYIAMGETQSTGTTADAPRRQGDSSTITHELGHYLGLPDLYDTEGDGTASGGGGDASARAWDDFDVNGLSVMALGSWGSDVPMTDENYATFVAIPTRLDPVCSAMLGFSGIIEVSEEGEYTAQASATDEGYQAYIFAAPGSDSEYFIVENRGTQGFDRGLLGMYHGAWGDGKDTTGGLVVWHWDADVWRQHFGDNTVNTADHRPGLMPCYIETGRAGDATSPTPETYLPFRTASYMDALDGRSSDDRLLAYGTGDAADDPAARTNSGWGIRTSDEASDAMIFSLLRDEDAAGADAEGSREATILFTNDVHGAGLDPDAEGFTYASIAALERDAAVAAGSGNVTLVDAGDAVQGDALATLTQGEIPVAAMGAAGYDYAVPGNHEFDYGVDRLRELMAQAGAEGITYLASNVVDIPANETLMDGGGAELDTYLVGDKEVVIGYVGITTPESLTKSRPSNFQDENGETVVGFRQDETGEALYTNVQAWVDWLRACGADYVVAVGHLGNRGVTPRWSSEAVIANTTGIDALIDGHSHEQYVKTAPNAEGSDVLLMQTGTKLASIGRLTIDASGELSAELIEPADYGKRDAAVSELLAGYKADYDELLSEQVAESAVDMPWEAEDGTRLATIGETNLGDLVADAYRVRMGADIGMTNAGGIRAPIDVGPITYGEALSVQPYGNGICMIKATGQEILDALEMGARYYPVSDNGLLQVSGLSYAIDPSVPTSVVTDDSESFVRVDGQRRVHSVTVGGEPIDPARSYTVASHTFLLRDGGDGMSMFSDNEAIVDEGTTDIQTLIDYIQDDLGGLIEDGYENASGVGRIVAKAIGGGSGEGGGDNPGGNGGSCSGSENANGAEGGEADTGADGADDSDGLAGGIPATADTSEAATSAALAAALASALAIVAAATRVRAGRMPSAGKKS